jgi:DNA-binding response OmpR family regulator
MMPKNGYEVYDEIKQDSNLMYTPFLFITAKATSKNRREGMILSADDYITKPFDIDLLIKSIKARLKKERKESMIKFFKNKIKTCYKTVYN